MVLALKTGIPASTWLDEPAGVVDLALELLLVQAQEGDQDG